MMIVFIHPCNDQPLFKLRWKAATVRVIGCWWGQRQQWVQMLPLEAGERGPPRPCGYAEPQLGERDGAHSSIPLQGLAQVPFHCQARGMKGCKGCSTDVTCWGSVALASKCHVWQLVRSSLPHQLLAERLLKDAKDACTGGVLTGQH